MVETMSDSDFLEETNLSGGENSDDDEIDERIHGKLLASISSMDGKKRTAKTVRSEASLTISEFNTIEGNGEKIKVHELLATLKQPNTTDLKKQVRSVARKSKVLPTPLHRVAAERIKRSVAYQEVGEKVSKWDNIVLSNRLADHLEFPLKQADLRIQPTKTIVSKFKPKTPLELEVAKLLNNSENMLTEDKPLTEAEEKCLKAMSYEEAKERLNELRKMRALLSYQEAKARRQKKIKSKRYHRILKKERIRKEMKEFEELKKTEPEKAAEKLAEIDRLRIEERMSLKHKSTGKWAKQHALRAKYNKDSRDALSEQLEISKKLTEKRLIIEDSDDSEDEHLETIIEEMPDTNSTKSGGEETLIPSSYNPWFKDPFSTEISKIEATKVTKEKEKPKSSSELKEASDDEPEPVSDSVSVENKKPEEIMNMMKKNEKIIETKDLDIEEIFHVDEKTPKKTRKRIRNRKRKASDVNVVQQTQNVQEDEVQDEELITETLEKKDKMEDFEDYEPVESVSKTSDLKEADIEEKTLTNPKKVQVDPTNFVMVKAKNLKSKMPKQIEDLNEDEEDQDESGDEEDEEEKRRMTISEAFADDDVLEEFKAEKLKAIDDGKPKAISNFLPGWGAWGGIGIKVSKQKKRRFRVKPPKALPRKDGTLGNVIIKEGVDSQKAAIHRISELPYPFTNVEQFERSLAQPIGKTWNPETSYHNFIQPKVEIKKGKIIDPIDSDALMVKKTPKVDDNNDEDKITFVKRKSNSKPRNVKRKK